MFKTDAIFICSLEVGGLRLASEALYLNVSALYP